MDDTKERKRSKNFLDEEKEYLLELITSKKSIIENKKTDGSTSQQKQKAWISVAARYNASAKTGPRTVQQLKLLYDNLKKNTKKKLSDDKIEVYKTGGGWKQKNDAPKISPACENLVIDLLGPSIRSLENPFDSNEILEAETDITMPGPSSCRQPPSHLGPTDQVDNSPINFVRHQSKYTLSSDESDANESVITENVSPSPIQFSPVLDRTSSMLVEKSNAPPKVQNFFKAVEQKKRKNRCNMDPYQQEILKIKWEKHNMQMEILTVIKKKEQADLEYKKVGIEIKKVELDIKKKELL